MRKILALAASALVLMGCAATSSLMLTEDTALVSVNGTSGADRVRVIEASLAEAAKITRAEGYRYFTITSALDRSRSGTRVIPGNNIPNESSHERPLGTTSFADPYRPGASYATPGTSVHYVKPGIAITIRMYRDAGEIDRRIVEVWNAESVPVSLAAAR